MDGELVCVSFLGYFCGDLFPLTCMIKVRYLLFFELGGKEL